MHSPLIFDDLISQAGYYLNQILRGGFAFVKFDLCLAGVIQHAGAEHAERFFQRGFDFLGAHRADQLFHLNAFFISFLLRCYSKIRIAFRITIKMLASYTSIPTDM